MPRIDPVDGDLLPPERLDDVIRRLRAGEIIVFPTETLYGLGCDPLQEAALSRLAAIKGRPADKPLPLIAASTAAAERVVLRPSARVSVLWTRLTSRFWPGPLTLVLEAAPGLPAAVTAGTGRVGVRVSSLPLARQMAQAAGGVIVATSANRSGWPVPVTARGVGRALGEGVHLILDGGRLEGGAPSTVVAIADRPPSILREGAVPAAELAAVLDDPADRPG
jgi:L-threonylcarbamoyladenylate synthase